MAGRAGLAAAVRGGHHPVPCPAAERPTAGTAMAGCPPRRRTATSRRIPGYTTRTGRSRSSPTRAAPRLAARTTTTGSSHAAMCWPVYSSDPLTGPAEVIGPVAAGRARRHLGRGVRRDGQAALRPPERLRAAAVRWRAAAAVPGRVQPPGPGVTPGEVYEVSIPMWDTCVRLGAWAPAPRLEIASSAFPKIDVNLGTGGDMVTETDGGHRGQPVLARPVPALPAHPRLGVPAHLATRPRKSPARSCRLPERRSVQVSAKLRHATVTPCLQSPARVSSTLAGLARHVLGVRSRLPMP